MCSSACFLSRWVWGEGTYWECLRAFLDPCLCMCVICLWAWLGSISEHRHSLYSNPFHKHQPPSNALQQGTSITLPVHLTQAELTQTSMPECKFLLQPIAQEEAKERGWTAPASVWLLLLPPKPTAAMAAEARWEAVPVLKDLLPIMECDGPPPPVEMKRYQTK